MQEDIFEVCCCHASAVLVVSIFLYEGSITEGLGLHSLLSGDVLGWMHALKMQVCDDPYSDRALGIKFKVSIKISPNLVY